MSNVKMFCDALPNIPWQEKPADVTAPVWRYNENPIIDRNPVEGVARIFNSAVVPYEGASARRAGTAAGVSPAAAGQCQCCRQRAAQKPSRCLFHIVTYAPFPCLHCRRRLWS